MDKNLISIMQQSVKFALEEDVGSGDVTAGLITQTQQARAQIITRQDAIICGTGWVEEAFRQIDDSIAINWQVSDGDSVKENQVLCTISGSARNILTAERCALNFLQTLSGTATVTHHYANLVKGTACQILDTRKTIPGLRLAQKYAVKTGGGANHRIGLFDGVLIKENHIRSAGSLQLALKMAQQHYGDSMMIEVEVESIEELNQALNAGAKRIMLDNFDVEQMKVAVEQNNNQAKLEASGNITDESIFAIAQTGVDYISLGALTKHVNAIDLSLLFQFDEASQDKY